MLEKEKGFIFREKRDIYGIYKRIKSRNFSGDEGKAVKNSIYNFGTNLVWKLGSFLFMVILARLLMPELFGLYALSLSTIILFASFSEMGFGQTAVKFISHSLGQGKKSEAKAYFIYLAKIKFFFIFLFGLLLLFSAKFLADTYYEKPIYLALLAGSAFVFFFEIIIKNKKVKR